MSITAETAIEAFGIATEENQVCRHRIMQTVHLPGESEVWMTGDLHDHRRNLDKLIRAADLGTHPDRHLVLHELIHGDHYDAAGAEDSWVTLLRAAELKCDFPDQVHFLLANHDLAQIFGEGISKNGVSVCEAFTAALKRDFGQNPYRRVERGGHRVPAVAAAGRADAGRAVLLPQPADRRAGGEVRLHRVRPAPDG